MDENRIIPYIEAIFRFCYKRLDNLENGPFPLRKDGGYGWFIVEETVDENELCALTASHFLCHNNV